MLQLLLKGVVIGGYTPEKSSARRLDVVENFIDVDVMIGDNTCDLFFFN